MRELMRRVHILLVETDTIAAVAQTARYGSVSSLSYLLKNTSAGRREDAGQTSETPFKHQMPSTT